jgi:hypothetical protein
VTAAVGLTGPRLVERYTGAVFAMLANPAQHAHRGRHQLCSCQLWIGKRCRRCSSGQDIALCTAQHSTLVLQRAATRHWLP